MPDYVFDASVVAMANGQIAGRRPGNVFDKRLRVLEQVVNGTRRLRYNPKLLVEYQQLVKTHRNDVIEVFFAVLDSGRSVRVARNTLTRQHHTRATSNCAWPGHDQHLLAAAIGGDDPSVFVTEDRLAQCAARILAHFSIHIKQLA